MEGDGGHYARKLTEGEINKLQKDVELNQFQQIKLEKEAKRNWDLFYKRNSTNFFKDRHWITREFPELRKVLSKLDFSHPVMLEVGCGVGNTLFPLLEENDAVFVHAFDFSPRAVEFVKVITQKLCSIHVHVDTGPGEANFIKSGHITMELEWPECFPQP